ncbi:LYR motif-containing protein 1-like [Nematostella vectensis]|uniref:LYR motif-containing protein 1-like n=1 Tax=Nematostella vectensis TaxID=45351 RepID=UPI002077752A|nr:LYR motif-containing protein 1-like [Nematostella vectensis]
MMSKGRDVLNLYKRILTLSKTWQPLSSSSAQVVQERKYIKDEARNLFKKNKNISDVSEIDQCIKEAESRIEMALHYGTAYPRMINVPPAAIAKSGTHQRKVQDRIRQQAKPTYLHSYEEIEK